MTESERYAYIADFYENHINELHEWEPGYEPDYDEEDEE